MEASEDKINEEDWNIFGIHSEDLTEEFKLQTQIDMMEVINNIHK